LVKAGYAYWPARIHPQDAIARGIENGDVIKLYNDRAGVLCAAVLTERIRQGIVHAPVSSAKYHPLQPENPHSVDRGGCVALLTPGRMMSQNVADFEPTGVSVLNPWASP
jgi:anaerobic selenocysteine-containing dehydrogenase